jgi:hypothetical protein
MSASVEDPRQRVFELARIALSAGRPLLLRVVGDSMYPMLQADDSIWVAPIAFDRLRRGDLVVLRQAGELVTHRVVSHGPEGMRTKGDNRLGLDPPFSEQEVLGWVVAIERAGVRIDLQKRRWGRFNRFVGSLSWGEAWLYQMARRVANRAPTEFLRRSLRRLGRFAGLPLTLLRRALSYFVRFF